MPASAARQAPALPWLAAEPLEPSDGLIPMRDPSGHDVLYVPHDNSVASDRTVHLVERVTALLARIGTTAPLEAHRELVRIAALCFASVMWAAAAAGVLSLGAFL